MAGSARAAQAVAAIAIAGVLACIALVFEAGRRAYQTIGPSKAVAARDGSLYVLSHGAVHVFDAAGKRVARHDLAAMGAPRVPADMAVHDDGRVVLADPDGNQLLVCPPAGRCTALISGLQRAPGKAEFTHNAAKVTIDEAGQRYFVADNAGHRVLLVGLDGRILARSAPGVVWYPNGPRMASANELMVVDTNHHRVAFFDVSNGRLDRVARSMGTTSGIARATRRWPFDAVRFADGGSWVLVARDGMKDADIVVFDASGRATRRIDLGADMDPFSLEQWQGRVVVADATRYRLDAIDGGGVATTAVADADFLAELDTERRRFHAWKVARMAAQAGIVLVPLLAILVLWRLGVPLGRPVPQAAAYAAAPLGERPHWLEADDAYLRALRKGLVAMAMIMGAFVLVMGATMWWRLGSEMFAPRYRLLIGMMLLVAIGAVGGTGLLLRMASTHARATRLGAARDGLHYELPTLQARFWWVPASGKVPWAEVHFDGRRLLVGRLVLLVRPPLGKKGLFAFDELARWVLPAIPAANRLSPGQLSRLMYRRNKPVAALVAATLALILAGLLLRFVFRSL